MRIASIDVFNIARNSLADANQSISVTQRQLSSGQRVNSPADDPIAAARILQITDELALTEQYRRNINIAEDNLSLEEVSINSINGLLQRIQEIAVTAGNTATLSPNEYSALSEEVDVRLDELQNLLNTRNAGGDYIFGGFKSGSQPFVGNAESGFQYVGDDGQKFIRVSNNTTIAANDSGKSIFVDVPSSQNTIQTSASPNNQSQPPVQIDVGRVVDQEAFDQFYPEDLVIRFNADSNVVPETKNYTITERSTNRVVVENVPYIAGEEITVNGVAFRISGEPVSGTPASAATHFFGTDSPLAFPVDFTAPNNQTFDIRVNGITETFILDANITDTTALANVLNDTVNGNAGRLAKLGLTVDQQGLRAPSGANFSVLNGSAATDAVTGLDTQFGSNTVNGVLATQGDTLFVESSNRQDILTTLARFSDLMRNYDGSADQTEALRQGLGNTLDDLEFAQTNTLNTLSSIGARINTLDSTTQAHLDTEIISSQILSELRDVDFSEAASRLAQQSLILEAAQQSFIRITRLTLFSQL